MAYTFHEVTKKSALENNLTELNAYASVDHGFMAHSDWVGHIQRYGHALKQVEKRKPQSILDIGCGDMNLIKFLWRNRTSFHGAYAGVDLRASAAWLDDITWKGDIDLFRMDIVADDPSILLPADMVICFETFEHVPRGFQQELLTRLFNWTKPGGICLFSTPNAGVAKSTAENHQGSDGIRERSYAEKLKMVVEAGFTVLNTYGTFCGSTRLPAEFLVQPEIRKMKEFLMDSMFVSTVAAAFPEQSNNSLFELVR